MQSGFQRGTGAFKSGHRGLHRGALAIEGGQELPPGLPLDSPDIRPAGVSLDLPREETQCKSRGIHVEFAERSWQFEACRLLAAMDM